MVPRDAHAKYRVPFEIVVPPSPKPPRSGRKDLGAASDDGVERCGRRR